MALLTVKGSQGHALADPVASEVTYEIGDGGISVQPANETKRARSFWGMQRTLG